MLKLLINFLFPNTFEVSNRIKATVNDLAHRGHIDVPRMNDFSVIIASNLAVINYCLRIVKSDGTLLDRYSVYPEIIVSPET